jgi:hypothetical protein
MCMEAASRTDWLIYVKHKICEEEGELLAFKKPSICTKISEAKK